MLIRRQRSATLVVVPSLAADRTIQSSLLALFLWGSLAVPTCVVVQCKIIRTAFQQSLFLRCKHGQTLGQTLQHTEWVIAKPQRIGKPSYLKFLSTLTCSHVQRVCRIVRCRPIPGDNHGDVTAIHPVLGIKSTKFGDGGRMASQ